MDDKIADSFSRAFSVIKRLRDPDGCPWDREQTPLSMRGNLIEEAYEAVEAINEKEPGHIREELGDVFLLAMMISYMYEQENAFTVSDVFDGLSDKLIRRHPHVFAVSNANTPEAVVKQWNEIKEKVEGRGKKNSVMDEVSSALPPLERAYKLQKKAAKVGFDWSRVEDVWGKVEEELEEAKEAAAGDNHDRREEEIGDLLFSVVNISRFLRIDPMVALHRCVGKFISRFKHVEKAMADEGRTMSRETFERMDELWDEAKAKGL
jgi:tetrapyrrole methylase family protein/MazG family protein